MLNSKKKIALITAVCAALLSGCCETARDNEAETSGAAESITSENGNGSSAAEISKEDKIKKLAELSAAKRDPHTCDFSCGDGVYMDNNIPGRTYSDVYFDILLMLENSESAQKASEIRILSKEDLTEKFNAHSGKFKAEIIENCDFYDAMIYFMENDTPYPIITENESDGELSIVFSCSYCIKRILVQDSEEMKARDFSDCEQDIYSVIRFTEK